MQKHLFDRASEVCIACGMPRLALEQDGKPFCDGKIQYREWIRQGIISLEPIIPQASLAYRPKALP